MSAPVITPVTSLNIYTRGQYFAVRLGATNLPASVIAVTGTQSSSLINAVAHGLPNGTRVKFTAITGGAGLTAGVTYYVVTTATDTFQLALTSGGSPINFTTDITAGVINAAIWTCVAYDATSMALVLSDLGLTFDTATGILRGAFLFAGFYAFTFTATNADGTSAAVTVPVGIEDTGFLVDATIGVKVDVETGMVTSDLGSGSDSTGAVPVLYGKSGTQMLITITFVKQGQAIPIDITELYVGFKQYEPDDVLDITDGTFYALNGGFRIVLNMDQYAVDLALGDYETDSQTLFNAIAEVRYKHNEQTTSMGSPVELLSRSKNFVFQVERKLLAA